MKIWPVVKRVSRKVIETRHTSKHCPIGEACVTEADGVANTCSYYRSPNPPCRNVGECTISNVALAQRLEEISRNVSNSINAVAGRVADEFEGRIGNTLKKVRTMGQEIDSMKIAVDNTAATARAHMADLDDTHRRVEELERRVATPGKRRKSK